MKILLQLALLLCAIALINAKLHRLQIHRENGPFKTIKNIIADEKYVEKKYSLDFNVDDIHQHLIDQASTFYSYIFVGTPGQQVEIAFDTILYAFVVPTRQYEVSLSSTSTLYSLTSYYYYYPPMYVVHFPMQYGDGFTGETEIVDNVQLADVIVPRQKFLQGQFKRGLFGLGPNSTQPLVSSILNDFFTQTKLPRVFSMYLVHESEYTIPKYGGEVIFGGSDPSLYAGELTYVNVIKLPGWGTNWGIHIDAVKIMDEEISTNIDAVVDSSVDFIGCPIAQYGFINSKINGTMASHRHYTVDCNTIDTLPNVEFTISGKVITLIPTNYIVKILGPNGDVNCLSAFFYTTNPYYVLGTTFMVGTYFEFDSPKNRIGFAPATPYTGSTNVVPIEPPKKRKTKVCIKT